MKVFAKRMTNTSFEDVPVDQDLGIVIEHNGSRYTISEDNSGKLAIRSVDKVQLILRPKSANAVEIESES